MLAGQRHHQLHLPPGDRPSGSLPRPGRQDPHPRPVDHVLLHDDGERTALDRARVEVEAESTAYLVCATLGIDTDDYSFPYLARWSQGDTELIQATAERAISCARRILTDLGLAVTDRAA